MAFLLKPKIFKLYGPEEKNNDTYKDIDGKGIFERYNESLAEDFDEEILILINNLVGNTMDPFTVQQKFIAYLEEMLGVNFSISDTIARRRKFLSIINHIYDIKSTIPAYQIMLKWLGFDTVDIIEYDNAHGFDSPFTFDDKRRRFDNKCGKACGQYSIQLTGTVANTPDIVSKVFKIIEFNEPIDAELRSVTFNGSFIGQNIISFQIVNGDLIYNNDLDPDLILRIATQADEPTYKAGDLIVEGPNAIFYSITPEGDLIYTTGLFYFNNALKLNGPTENVEYEHISAYNLIGQTFQIAFWIRVDDLLNPQEILSKKNGSSAGWRIYYDSNKIVIATSDGTDSNLVESEALIVDDTTWYWVAITINGPDASLWEIYINNVLNTTNVITNNQSSSVVDNAESIFIGKFGTDYGVITIDEILIKTGEMTPVQRNAYYGYGSGEDPVIAGVQDIVLRSNFDEVLGTVIFDQSVNGNNGILNNAPGDSTNRILH